MKRNLIYHTQIPVSKTVTTTTESGQYDTELGCISRDGMALTCNRQTLDEMFPNTYSVAPRQPKKLTVEFSLPGLERKLKTSCEVHGLRRLSRDVFELLMKFESLSDTDFELVDDYVGSKLKSLNPELIQAA